MKTIRILIIMIIVMAVLASCGIEDNGAINNNAAQPAESNNTIVSKEVSFTAHNYKFEQVKNLIPESDYLSKVKIIENRKTLEAMKIEINRTLFDQTEFENLINSYTDEWFKSHQLLAFATMEASGSNLLEVKQVINGVKAKVVVERQIPELGGDMNIGPWIIFIETENVFINSQDIALEIYEVKKPYEEMEKDVRN